MKTTLLTTVLSLIITSNVMAYTSLNQNAFDQINYPTTLDDSLNKVKVAVVDTGITLNENNKAIFEEVVLSKVVCEKGSHICRKAQQFDKSTVGHGTHVAGIVMQVAGKTIGEIVDVNFSLDGENANIKGLRAAIDENVSVINYSFTGISPINEERELIEEAGRKGILVIAAAGNQASGEGSYPCNYHLPNVICVGATGENNDLLYLGKDAGSNYGPSLDLFAPGEDIISSDLGETGFGKQSGTSQAAPFVTGTVALIKATFPELSALEIKKIIVDTVSKNGALVGKAKTGGILNVVAAIQKAKQAKAMWKKKKTPLPLIH